MNKEIEEMMLTVLQKIIAYDGNPAGQHLYGEQRQEIAEALYNAGYRKLPEDSVVLSREEHEILVKTAQGKIGNMKATDLLKACISSGFMVEAVSTKEQVKQAVKEFAEKLQKELPCRDYTFNGNTYSMILTSSVKYVIDKLLKEYKNE